MRSFLAVEIPEVIRQALRSQQEELKASKADVKWVRPESIHLTLKFLGEIDAAMVDEIRRVVGKVVRKHDPFHLKVRGVGCFPRLRQPRVVWSGLAGELEALKSLQQEVEEGVAALGFPTEERPFRAHLTMGRVRSPRARERLVTMIQRLTEVELGEFTVGSVVQFQSELHPSGARYTHLWEEFLGGQT